MLETKETILEYWNGMRLTRRGYAKHEAVLRNKLDSWFISKGFNPMYRAFSEHFAEYYNPYSRQAIFVDELMFFNDALVSNEGWGLVYDEAEEKHYFAPYNAMRDIGYHWGYRELTYTDVDNSTTEDLQKTITKLKEHGLAYEL